MTSLELRLPVAQEELDVSCTEFSDRSSSEPVDEAPQRVRVLAAGRESASPPTEIGVETCDQSLSSRLLVF